MNAEIRQIKTTAEQALAASYGAAKAKLPGGKPVAALRDTAFKLFEREGLPHRRVEEWKYTDLRALMRDAKPLAAPPDQATLQRSKQAGQLAGLENALRLTFVDGAFVAELSNLKALPTGLTVTTLREALSKGDAETLQHLGQVLPVPNDATLALNTALMGDGAVVHVAAGANITRPIHFAFISASGAAHATFCRSLVVIGAGAQVTLVESHEGLQGVDYQVNHALELSVADKAKVEHVKIVAEGDKALHVGSLMAVFGKDVNYNGFTFSIGGAVTRNQVFARFDGENTHATISGASLLKNRQHVDNTLVIDHAVGHCISRELFKSVLDDESRAVFQGKIIVQPHAQKTDGKMMSNALLLSENAEADHKPELEIFADDVVCGHGATAGALDDDLLFYLRARGIPEKEAQALMIQAFVGEAIESIADEGVRAALLGTSERWLASRG